MLQHKRLAFGDSGSCGDGACVVSTGNQREARVVPVAPLTARGATGLLIPRFFAAAVVAALLLLPASATGQPSSSGQETRSTGIGTEPDSVTIFENLAAGEDRDGGLVGLQRHLSGRVEEHVRRVRDETGLMPWAGLLLFSVAYGMVHGVLPGHRKTLLFSYFLAEDARPMQGVVAGVSFAALHVLATGLLIGGGAYLWSGGVVSVTAAAAPWIHRVTGVMIAVLGTLLFASRLIEFLRTRGDWREQKYISKLAPLDKRIDPENEDPAVHLAVAHARRLRRRRRSEAPVLPAVIVSGVVPCSATAAVVAVASSLAVPLAGIVAGAGIAIGVAAVLTILSVLTISVKERIVDALPSRQGHFTHMGMEFAGAALMIGFGATVLVLAL